LQVSEDVLLSDLFPFDELTYPEVASLPRDTPLVLPLGWGYDHVTLAARLGNPPQIGRLPALPFGWQGSGLDVAQPVFEAVLRNLLGNLLEDGFTQVFALLPSGLKLAADIPALILPSHSLLTSLPSNNDRGKVILIPIGHTEQHGCHAPLSTDTLIIEAISRGTAKAVPEQAVCLPANPYGVSTHRRSFPGTFNVGGRAFEDFWLAVVDALVGRGFNRFYLLSGHGGNCSFLVNVVKYAGERHPYIFCATTGLYLNGPKGASALEAKRESPLGGMGHACELETSLILALRPELIHLERAVDETNFIATPSYYMDWIEGGALIANPPWDDDTQTGAYGAGSLGTKEKGEYWLKVAIEEKVDHVAEIHEQYRRRRERRPAPTM
jgi:creatinine amidohydrolase